MGGGVTKSLPSPFLQLGGNEEPRSCVIPICQSHSQAISSDEMLGPGNEVTNDAAIMLREVTAPCPSYFGTEALFSLGEEELGVCHEEGGADNSSVSSGGSFQ